MLLGLHGNLRYLLVFIYICFLQTVRVVANLCLCERAGRGLAAFYAERTVQALLACLEIAAPENHNQNTVKNISFLLLSN